MSMSKEERDAAEAAFISDLTEVSRKHGIVLQYTEFAFTINIDEEPSVAVVFRDGKRYPMTRAGHYTVDLEWEEPS